MKIKAILFFVFFTILFIQYVYCEDNTVFYEVRHTCMAVPLNKIVLIKKEGKMGAFKFIHFEKKKAEYEWYYPFGVKNTEIKRGKGKLNDKILSLIGKLCFQLGNTRIKCGSLKLWWTGNNVVAFFDTDEDIRNSSVELAPTNKEKIEDIDLNSSRLKWYKYDESRKEIKIPLDAL